MEPTTIYIWEKSGSFNKNPFVVPELFSRNLGGGGGGGTLPPRPNRVKTLVSLQNINEYSLTSVCTA